MKKFLTRRNFLKFSGATGATLLFNPHKVQTKANPPDQTSQTAEANHKKTSKIPIILDTDIGGDIDDAWALALILKSPEFDLKMLLTDTGKPTYRGAIAGKYLEAAGRTDIPIGLGIPENEGTGPQEAWLGDYQLSDYPGQIYEDGVGRMIELIMNSPEPITLICTGPVPNIPVALKREPRIVENTKVVGMFGSLRYGYNGSEVITNETNVRLNPDACRQLFRQFPDVTITPLDTCGIVYLKDKKYKRVHDSKDPLKQTLIESYYSWAEYVDWVQVYPMVESSTLFDTVAVYLALSEEYVEIENLGIRVTDDGFTLIDPNEKAIRCATIWKDLPAFEDWLLNRLIS
ncbi:MAG: nucleoside hydrolase [Xenococcus sp. (in: cyanobacteria)]